jgi:hypothetical protein
MLLVMSFLSGCASGSVTVSCPPPIWPDELVYEELDTVPLVGYEDFWKWMADVEKLNEQLEVCL